MNLMSLLKQLWVYILPRRRTQLVFLSILIILASFSEVVAIGAVLPFLAALADPESVFSHELAQPVVRLLGIGEPSELITSLTLAFASAAVIAGAMRLGLYWVQVRVGHAIGADIGYEIYRRTLYQSYSTYVVRNSSEVISTISTKANQVVNGVVSPVLNIISSLVLLMVILATLITIHPVVAISGILAFGSIYALIILFTRKRLLQNGKMASSGATQVVKVVQEGLGGIRDILIDGTQPTFCEAFRSVDVPMRRALANSQVISLSPRYVVESFGMVLIAGIAYYLVKSPEGLAGALPVLGALALGAQRMLPALQQVYAGLSANRSSQAMLQDTLALLQQSLPSHADHKRIPSMSFEHAISLNEVSFRYLSDSPLVLKNLSIEINKGSRVGVVGITGSGKSTLLDILMGLLHPTEGEMLIDGNVVNKTTYCSWQAHIAHVPQTIFLSDASAAENIAFGVPKNMIDMERVREAARIAQIAQTIESWDQQYDSWVGERGVRLSGGQRQRIGIARALYKKADVLVFDEATSALDNDTEQAVMKAIETSTNRDITILMVAHRLTTLQTCDQIIELKNGEVKRQGTYDEMIG